MVISYKIKKFTLFSIGVISFFLILEFYLRIIDFNFLSAVKSGFSPIDFYDYISSLLAYETFTKNAIPKYSIVSIIPLPILFLFFIGIFSLYKKRIWLLTTTIIGGIYWVFYSYSTDLFLIGYQRVVFTTSILMIIVSGFGLNTVIRVFKKNSYIYKNKVLSILQVIVLILFLVLVPQYTKRENWIKLKLYDIDSNQEYFPAAPANQYLHKDDLRIFKNIQNKIFLSSPWKGTVLGVATNNYPVSTKAGTITINRKLYTEFINANCNKKGEIINQYSIDYLYISVIDCPNLEFIDQSKEGLVLYKIR